MVTAKGNKSYYVIKKFRGEKHVLLIGAVNEIPLPQARQLAVERITSLLAGDDPREIARSRDTRHTLGQVFDRYFDFLSEHRKLGAVPTYRRLYTRYLYQWHNRKLDNIRRKEVSALHIELGRKCGRHLANRVIQMLRAAINRTIREFELEITNPAHGITLYKEGKRSRRLEPEELPRFFQAVLEEPNPDIRDFILLLLYTGARKSNLLAMRWDAVSFDRELWIIPAEESKTGEELPVVLTKQALEILDRREPVVKGEYVFPGRRGAAHMMDPKVGWQRILSRAGIEDLRMHDLRRSLASFQIDTGTSIEVIQKTLGHGNKATKEIYARLALDPVRVSLEKATEEIMKQAGCNTVS